MVILSIKRILSIFCMVFVALFAFVIQKANLNKTVATVSIPVTNKVIVIDAGHGIPDERCSKLLTEQQKPKPI